MQRSKLLELSNYTSKNCHIEVYRLRISINKLLIFFVNVKGSNSKKETCRRRLIKVKKTHKIDAC